MKLVAAPDTSSESWRHACEVRAAASMPAAERGAFLELVSKYRGVDALGRILDDLVPELRAQGKARDQ